MTLYQRADIYVAETSATTNKDAIFAENLGLLCILTSEPGVRTYSTLTTAICGHATLSGTISAGIALVSLTCAVVVYNSSSQVSIVNLVTMAFTTWSTGGGTVGNSTQSQQVAGNTNTGFAMSTSATASVRLINTNTWAMSALSPSILSGTTPTCIALKGNNFLVGTANGIIFEITTGGSVIQSVTIPTNNNVGTTVTPNICGISWSSPNVMCTTNEGIGYVLNWGASSIIDQFTCSDGTLSGLNPTLCTASNAGTTLIGTTNRTGSNYIGDFSEVYFAGPHLAYETHYFYEGFSNILAAGYDNTNNKAFFITAAVSNDDIRCRVFDTDNISTVSIDTRIQNPPGTDISGRIIRIRANSPGRSLIESDQVVAAGDVNLNAIGGRQYIELATNNLSGVNEKWDVREF